MAKDINKVMETIPEGWRTRWCGGENGACRCMGCVQIGNRPIMVKEFTGNEFRGDPEYIDERQIPKEIYDKHKISKTEWENWIEAQTQY